MAALCSEKKALVVCGPTATGKTGLAVALARRFGGEVISADSMQIYRGLDIGTAKATQAEQGGIPHHMIDILSPEAFFSAADYQREAAALLNAIWSRGSVPILAGGTGQYISSVVNGTAFTPAPPDPALRASLLRMWEEEGAAAMYARLAAVDPERAAMLHPNDKTRVLRALEIFRQTGRSSAGQAGPGKNVPGKFLVLYLTFRDRQRLYTRINSRVDNMLANGLLAEAQYVYHNKSRFVTAGKAIGYKELFPYFDGTMSLGDCVEKLKQASRNYAKRQMTWFGSMEGAVPIYMDEEGAVMRAQSLAAAFLTGDTLTENE